MSEAKNKMSIIERIRSRIGELALYGGKTVCDSPCRFISLTKTRQALRLAFGTICAQIVAANSTKNTTGKGKIMKNTLRGIENCGQFSMIADLLKKARAMTTNNKESSLRATSEDKGSANSYKEIFELFATLAHKKNRIGRCLTSLHSGHDILCNTLWGTLTPKDVNVMANLIKSARMMATNNKASSLRATSEDKGSANSYKEIFEFFAALTHKKNRIGRSLIVQSCAERAMTIKAKIITATKIMNITFNGGYHA